MGPMNCGLSGTLYMMLFHFSVRTERYPLEPEEYPAFSIPVYILRQRTVINDKGDYFDKIYRNFGTILEITLKCTGWYGQETGIYVFGK
jgi:hypothetical protein